MLLFIRLSPKFLPSDLAFQYISCYSLSSLIWKKCRGFTSFNTSHVTLYLWRKNTLKNILKVSIHLMLLFIKRCRWEFNKRRKVSIHLMLLFIIFWNLLLRTFLSFNTSHVTLYQAPDLAVDHPVERFNTSHVTLYHVIIVDPPGIDTFQYISCYSLSNHLNSFLLYLPCFNTSHVTLYLVKLLVWFVP